MAERLCVICQRPLPRRRWWMLVAPPPMCRGDQVRACQAEFGRRIDEERAT